VTNVDRFSKFFHQVIRKNILYVYITDFHLTCNMLLPSESRKSKNVTDFDSTSTDCWHVPEETLRILKIGPHLPKLLSNSNWLTFLGHSVV